MIGTSHRDKQMQVQASYRCLSESMSYNKKREGFGGGQRVYEHEKSSSQQKSTKVKDGQRSQYEDTIHN